MLRHPNLLAILGSKDGSTLHVPQWWVSVEVTRDDVNLLTRHRIVHQHIGILGVEAQGFGTNETHTLVGFPVKLVGMFLHEFKLLFWGVETARIVDPPVGLVLNGHSIDIDAVILHVLQERIEPREELSIAVCTQGTTLVLWIVVVLVIDFSTLSLTIGLVFAWRRPRGAEHNAATLLDNFSRG